MMSETDQKIVIYARFRTILGRLILFGFSSLCGLYIALNAGSMSAMSSANWSANALFFVGIIFAFLSLAPAVDLFRQFLRSLPLLTLTDEYLEYHPESQLIEWSHIRTVIDARAQFIKPKKRIYLSYGSKPSRNKHLTLEMMLATNRDYKTTINYIYEKTGISLETRER